jgi:hypothetical protein
MVSNNRITLHLIGGEELWITPDSITILVQPLPGQATSETGCHIPNPAGGWFNIKEKYVEVQKMIINVRLGYEGEKI